MYVSFGSSPIGLVNLCARLVVLLHGLQLTLATADSFAVIQTIHTLVELSSRPLSLKASANRIASLNPLQLGAAPGNQSDSRL